MIDNATPRPWTYGGTGNFIGGADQQRVADVYRDNLSADGRQANASLIVRAVNAYDAMREALRFTTAKLHEWPTTGRDNIKPDHVERIILKARAALALAESGEEGT